MTGAILFAGSLLMIPFIRPQAGGLLALLAVIGIFAVGNSLSGPALTSLASKSAGAGEQGGVLGVTQATASLARAVGPSISALLIYSAIQTYGADGQLHHLSDHALLVTFWTAAAIMFLAFLLAVYFARTYATDYKLKGQRLEARG